MRLSLIHHFFYNCTISPARSAMDFRNNHADFRFFQQPKTKKAHSNGLTFFPKKNRHRTKNAALTNKFYTTYNKATGMNDSPAHNRVKPLFRN